MGTDVTEAVEKLPQPYEIKVHSVMCTELMKLVDRIDKIFPEIEESKPRCSSGIQSLCLLNSGIDKAKSSVRDCSESSKLYLALTGHAVLSRCKKSKKLLEQSLSQIKDMVPVMLASKILQIIAELRELKLSLDPSEEEAGKAVRALLEAYDTENRSGKESCNECIRVALLKLQITSPKALLMERRSIKKLLNKLSEGDGKQPKKQILMFLLALLTKYGKSITSENSENDNIIQNQDYKSRKVDSRVDFQEARMGGNRVTLPDPCIQLSTDANWEYSSSSVNSLGSMYNFQLPVDFSNLSLGSLESSHAAYDACERDVESVSEELDEGLPWEVQCKIVEDLMTRLKRDDQDFKLVSFGNLVESVVKFLRRSRVVNDVKAQRIGCLLLLMLVGDFRNTKYLNEDAYGLIAEFLESEVIEEALAILEMLSSHNNCRSEIASSGALPYIFKILDTQIREIQTPALKILYNLTLTRTIRSLVVSLDLIPKLVTLSEDDSLSRYCIAILTNLCGNQDDKSIIAETDGCVSFIAKVLESDSCDEQEQALEILLSLCSQSFRYCRLVMDEGVIPALVSISINGNDKGKAKAHEMLRLLRDIEDEDYVKESAASDYDVSNDANSFHVEKKKGSRTSRFLSKLSRSSLAQKRKV